MLIERLKEVRDGQVTLSLPEFDGQKVLITVERAPKRRSTKANRYYWALLRLVETETGQESDKTHEWVKKTFNGDTVTNLLTGEEEVVGRTSTRCSSPEFAEKFIGTAQLLCEKLNIRIPTIDQYWNSLEDRGI